MARNKVVEDASEEAQAVVLTKSANDAKESAFDSSLLLMRT